MSFPEQPGDQTRQDDSAKWQPLPCTQAIPQDVCKWLWGAETPRPSLQALSGSSGPSCPRHLLAESLTSLGLSCPHVRQSWIKPVLTRNVGSLSSVCDPCVLSGCLLLDKSCHLCRLSFPQRKLEVSHINLAGIRWRQSQGDHLGMFASRSTE